MRSWRKAAATAMDLTTRAQLADRLRVAGEANGGGNGGVNGDGEKVCRSSRGSGLRLRCAKSIFLNPPRRRRLRNLTTARTAAHRLGVGRGAMSGFSLMGGSGVHGPLLFTLSSATTLCALAMASSTKLSSCLCWYSETRYFW